MGRKKPRRRRRRKHEVVAAPVEEPKRHFRYTFRCRTCGASIIMHTAFHNTGICPNPMCGRLLLIEKFFDLGGLGVDPGVVKSENDKFEAALPLIPEDPTEKAKWKAMASTNSFGGVLQGG